MSYREFKIGGILMIEQIMMHCLDCREPLWFVHAAEGFGAAWEKEKREGLPNCKCGRRFPCSF